MKSRILVFRSYLYFFEEKKPYDQLLYNMRFCRNHLSHDDNDGDDNYYHDYDNNDDDDGDYDDEPSLQSWLL